MNATPGTRPLEVLVVDRYWPSVTAERLLAAADGDLGPGTLASIVFEDDDRVLSLVASESVDEVEAANRARGLPFMDVAPAILLLSEELVGRANHRDTTEEKT